MKLRFAKRVLATTLSAALIVAPVMTAGAATTGSSKTTSTSTTTTATTTTAETPAVSAPATNVVSVGGAKITSSLPGSYHVVTLAGAAVTTPAADVAASLGLGSGEKAYVRAYDISTKTSPAAYTSIKAAATSVGGAVVGALNVDLGKMSGGKFTTLSDGSVAMTTGIPTKSFDANKTYAAVKVSAGGATEILKDQDTNPHTVTFAVSAGLHAYAIIAY